MRNIHHLCMVAGFTSESEVLLYIAIDNIDNTMGTRYQFPFIFYIYLKIK